MSVSVVAEYTHRCDVPGCTTVEVVYDGRYPKGWNHWDIHRSHNYRTANGGVDVCDKCAPNFKRVVMALVNLPEQVETEMG